MKAKWILAFFAMYCSGIAVARTGIGEAPEIGRRRHILLGLQVLWHNSFPRSTAVIYVIKNNRWSWLLLAMVLAPVAMLRAQDRKDGEYSTFSFKGQQNPELWVTMYARKTSWGMGQQFYGIQIENVTDKKLKVKGTYYAILTCGNEVSSDIDIVLGPHQKLGGNSFVMDATGLTASAESEDCKGNPIYENGKQVATNRIKSVGYQIAQITDMNLQQKTVENRAPQTYKTPSSTATTAVPPKSSGANTTNSSATRTSNGNYERPNPNQAIMDNLNRQLENNRNTYNAISNGIQDIGNMLLESQRRKQQVESEREAKREEEENRRKEEKRLRDAEERERQRQEQLRIDEENRARRENEQKQMDMQWNVDKQIIGSNLVLNQKTSQIPDNIKQVYYIVYERSYHTGEVSLRSYTLNKYSDGTWMLYSDLLNKIAFQTYFHPGGVGQMLGFYASKKEAVDMVNRIKGIAKIKRADDSFTLINGKATAAGTDKDFWNN